LLAKTSGPRHHGIGPTPNSPKEDSDVTVMTNIKERQDSYFTRIKKIEESMLEFADERAETFARFVPERPAFLAEMPTAAEFVENQLKFRKRFVDEQIAFTRKMVKALHPVFVKLDTAPKPEPKTTKATVTKMAAKKAA
jgi:hypothetical protein